MSGNMDGGYVKSASGKTVAAEAEGLFIEAQRLYHYDPVNGGLFWKVRRKLSTAVVGTLAGTKYDENIPSRHPVVYVLGKKYTVAAIIVLLIDGYLPPYIAIKDGRHNSLLMENIIPLTEKAPSKFVTKPSKPVTELSNRKKPVFPVDAMASAMVHVNRLWVKPTASPRKAKTA